MTQITPGELIRQARKAAGYSQKELAQAVGITQQSLQFIETNRTKHPRKLAQIESVLGLPAGFVDGSKRQIGLPQPIVARCPILSWEQAANWPQNKITLETVEQLSQQLILGNDCYALRVNNDAMVDPARTPFFRQGSYIIIDPNRDYKNQSFVLAKKEGHTELLFRQYIKEGDFERLRAFNHIDYPSLQLTSDIKIYGVVVAHLDILT